MVMSKLSGPLKALINAPHARPGPTASSKKVAAVYKAIAHDAAAKGVGLPAWLTISTAATMTMNSPDSLLELHRLATATATATPSSSSSSSDDAHHPTNRHAVYAAELMREVGLKCISFNGIPRSINCLGAFYTSLPTELSAALSTTPTRTLTERTLGVRLRRGLALWKSIYAPLDGKLTAKLGRSHPDLPVVIHQAHYAALLANPPPPRSPGGSASGLAETSPSDLGGNQQPGQRVGRVLTSLTGIACLRAQTGVGPQVLSHIFGLRKAYTNTNTNNDEGDGEKEQEVVEVVDGGEWLASDEGSVWLLEVVDRIVDAIGDGKGTSFAPPRELRGVSGVRAKL